MSQPQQPIIALPSELPPSVVRTVVPYIVGGLVMVLTKLGWHTEGKITYSVGQVVFAAAYYTLVRFLEIHHDERWGWLLGLAKAPAYSPAAPPAPALPVVVSSQPVPRPVPVAAPIPAHPVQVPSSATVLPVPGSVQQHVSIPSGDVPLPPHGTDHPVTPSVAGSVVIGRPTPDPSAPLPAPVAAKGPVTLAELRARGHRPHPQQD